MTDSPRDPAAQAYLLLTLNNARVVQVYAGQEMELVRGELVLECISLPINPTVGKQQANPFADVSDPTKDLWLVIKVDSFELPLLPDHKISKTSTASPNVTGETVFTIPSPQSKSGAMVKLYLPAPTTEEDQEDYETFEVLLKQYGCLPMSQVSREIKGSAAIASASSSDLAGMASFAPHQAAPASSMGNAYGSRTASPRHRRESREGGRFVLVDEETGHVIGELDNRIEVEVGKGVNAGTPGSGQVGGTAHEPVVVDFGVLDEGWAEKVTVTSIDERDMDDWMLKGAHYISKGLLMFGNTASKSLTSAAELYIRNSKPRAEPVKFSPVQKAGLRQVHNVSAKGVKVTKKTLNTVNDAIGRVVEKAAGTGYGGYDKAQTIWKTNYSERFGSSPESSRPSSATPDARPPPPYAEKPGQLQVDTKEKLGQGYSAPATAPALPTGKDAAPAPGAQPGIQPQSANATQRPFWNRLFLAADVIGTSLEATTQTLINSGTNAAAEAAGHKYGPEAGEATRILGGSVKNVALVYVDVRGVGRKTLFKSTAKGFQGVVKTRLADGKEVTITGQDENGNLTMAHGDNAAHDVTVAMQGAGMEEKVTPIQGYATSGNTQTAVDPRKMKKTS